MKYSISMVIEKPRDVVIAMMENQDNMQHWQDGFISYAPLEGTPLQLGSSTTLKYTMGKREVVMVETVVKRDLPMYLSATYEADKVWNLVENIFTETAEGHTHWQVDTEFKCGGLVGVMAFFMPGMFRKNTRKMMSQFKAFVEAA